MHREDDLAVLDRLNAAYIRSVQASDARWFDAHLAEDFLNTGPDGALSGRAAFIELVSRPAAISGLAVEDVRVRLFGDVAVIHGRTTYAKPGGERAAGRYTDVWVRREGRWLCVAAHVTRG